MRCDDIQGNIAQNVVQQKIDIQELLQAKEYLQSIPDDPLNGTFTTYKITNFKKELVPTNRLNVFCSFESYLFLYTYRPNLSGFNKGVAYFWQGSSSSIIEKGTCALLTVDMSEKFGGEITQIRVEQGKEPLHFLQIMKPGIVITLEEGLNFEMKPVVLDIRSVFDGLCKAVQVGQFIGIFSVYLFSSIINI